MVNMHRDNELDAKIIKQVKAQEYITILELTEKLKRHYPVIWGHVNYLLAKRTLVKVLFHDHVLNSKGERVDIYVETTRQGGRIVTPEYFSKHRYDALFRFEDAQAKGESIRDAKYAKWEKKYHHILKLIPVDSVQVVEENFKLKDEVEQLKERILFFSKVQENQNKHKGVVKFESAKVTC